MAPPNILAAAANARAASAEETGQEEAQVQALPTGETIEDFEPLSLWELDEKGHLYVEHDGLRNLIERLFGAFKDQSEKNNAFGEDIYDVRSNLTAVERQCVHLNVQLKDCQELVQKAMMQMNTMSISATHSPENSAAAQSGILSGQDQALTDHESIEDLTERFDNFERLTGDQLEKYQLKYAQLEESLARLEYNLDYDIGSRFDRNDDAMETLREDIDALRKRAVEEATKKADRGDIAKLTEWLARIEDGQRNVSTDVLKAKDDFKHLNEMANEMVDTRHQCQELWRLVREESREVRDWVSQGLDELRREVRSKAVATEVCDRLETLQKDVTGLAGRMQAVTHLKAQLNSKAEKNEVRRLQETSEFFTSELMNHGAVLAGTTCLACNRPMEKGDRSANGGRDDGEEYRGRRLIGEVRTALDKGQGDFLEYVAVNVGSPVRATGTDGRIYEGREPSPGPTDTPRPGTPGDLRLVQVRRPVSAAGSFASAPSKPPSRCASPNLTAGTKGPKVMNAPLYLRPTSRAATPDPTSMSGNKSKLTSLAELSKTGSKEGKRKSSEADPQPASPTQRPINIPLPQASPP